jgi:hypothetical protein
MAYSKAKLERSGDRPFWIEKLSDKYLPIWTLLYVSFKHISIKLASKLYENITQYFPLH